MESEIEIKKTGTAKPVNPQKKLRKALLTSAVCSTLAAFGIFGGISSLFVGLLCVVVHGFVSEDRAFDQVGTILLIIAIPLILTGSVFLDESNKKSN